MSHIKAATFSLAVALAAGTAHAADSPEGYDCSSIRFGQPNWTGVSIKTATAAWMLEELGYETKVTKGSLPITYNAMAGDDIDVMMAQWMPSQRSLFRDFGIKGSIDLVSPNLRGGRYTIAVPSYVYEAGVTSLADLDQHKEKFGGKIFGIEPGSGGNDTVKSMLEDDYAGLGDWELVASSEPGMLSEVGKRTSSEEWIAFLGWAPHPMNVNYDIEYLSGGSDYWGPNKGEVIVNTAVREGYVWACPNIGQFLDNYDWTVAEQSKAMAYVREDDMEPLEAGKKVVAETPKMLSRWFDRSGIYKTGGIDAADGETDARQAIEKAMDL